MAAFLRICGFADLQLDIMITKENPRYTAFADLHVRVPCIQRRFKYYKKAGFNSKKSPE